MLRRLAYRRAPRGRSSAWVAPVIGDVHLGENVSIWFGAVIRADNTRITVGARSNIQEQAVLGERVVRNDEVRGSIPLGSTSCACPR
jgi:carbonic anhydrase/acetyltransferase-like protein (isoleucine patch superfamily)